VIDPLDGREKLVIATGIVKCGDSEVVEVNTKLFISVRVRVRSLGGEAVFRAVVIESRE